MVSEMELTPGFEVEPSPNRFADSDGMPQYNLFS